MLLDKRRRWPVLIWLQCHTIVRTPAAIQLEDLPRPDFQGADVWQLRAYCLSDG
jgi:hypothetical protein